MNLGPVTEFFNTWGRIWYPDVWIDGSNPMPFVIFAIGIITVIVLIISAFNFRKRFTLILTGVFIWTLPALLYGIIELIAIVLAVVFVGAVLWFAFHVWANSDDSKEEEYIIKRENGKEVVYEKGFFDRKVGELHDQLGGSKETRNFLEPNVTVGKSDPFTTEREGEVEGHKGKFVKGAFDKHPTFKPDEDED